MSEGAKLPYKKAMEIAEGFVEDIRHCCERIEIAGSLRRKKAEVGDIEVVCIPKIVEGVDLFGGVGEKHSLLDEYVTTYQLLKNGPAMKQIQLYSIKVDLFVTTPEKWGVIYTIRTGCADFSRWLVTRRNRGGALPSFMSVNEGRIWRNGLPYDTPKEADVFEIIGLPWILPEERTGPRRDLLEVKYANQV